MDIGVKIGPDDSTAKITSIEIKLPDDGAIGITLASEYRAGRWAEPSRVRASTALARAIWKAAYTMTMIRGGGESIEEEIEALDDQYYELEASRGWDEPDPGGIDYNCEYDCSCAAQGCCAAEGVKCGTSCPCVRELLEAAREDLARDQAKLVYLESQIHEKQAVLEEAQKVCAAVADKTMTYAISGDAAVTSAATRPCACGCGRPVLSPRPEAKYATGACRVRAHRERAE